MKQGWAPCVGGRNRQTAEITAKECMQGTREHRQNPISGNAKQALFCTRSLTPYAAKLGAHHDLDAGVLVILQNVAVDLVVLAVLFAVDVVPPDSDAGAEIRHAGVVPEDVGVAASVEAWLHKRGGDGRNGARKFVSVCTRSFFEWALLNQRRLGVCTPS